MASRGRSAHAGEAVKAGTRKVKVYGRDCALDYEGPLEPPDETRCQFERREYHPFSLGGVHRVVRCEAKPLVIAVEKKSTRKDGARGSMALCLEHMALLAESAPGYCTFTEIKR
jgi:hypothetical protein